jgi:hypothetical protein
MGEEITIQSNIKRDYSLRIFLKLTNGEWIEFAWTDDASHRVYHKSNLFFYSISTAQVLKVIETQGNGADLESLVVQVDERDKSISFTHLMNLSPTYDKKHPFLWKIPAEPSYYLSV